MASGSGTSSAKVDHDPAEEEFSSNKGTNTQIKKHTPASTSECPSGYGSASVFKTKFQSEVCISCNQILAEANGKEYDIYVAHKLCPNIDMQANFMLIAIVFIIIVILAVVGGIVLGMKNAPATPDYGA